MVCNERGVLKRCFFYIFWLCLSLAWTSWFAQGAATPEQHQKLVETCRWLSKQDLNYSQSWQPPGHPYVITMDCSNTVRYIVWKVFGFDIPRTASDQYLFFKKKGKVRAVPVEASGKVDSERLMTEMRSGDLLFWEWTYDVPRDPPISHVMIYLGRKKMERRWSQVHPKEWMGRGGEEWMYMSSTQTRRVEMQRTSLTL